MANPEEHDIVGTADDPLTEAMVLAKGASDADIPLRLLGGLAVRVLCPDLPPRVRRDQDIDFACLSKGRQAVVAYLQEVGCVPDRRFNSLNGDRQMYFSAPSGRPIDIMVDRLSMCHTLDFRPGFGTMPHTLGVADVLLSKLQVVELNEKDAHDILHLLSTYSVGTAGQDAGEPYIDRIRFAKIVGGDWGWWRTVTGNLRKLRSLVEEHPHLLPAEPSRDALGNAQVLIEVAELAPKSVQWKIRSKVGERVRWYELPEEVDH